MASVFLAVSLVQTVLTVLVSVTQQRAADTLTYIRKMKSLPFTKTSLFQLHNDVT